MASHKPNTNHRWTEDETKFFIDHFQEFTSKEFAAKLGLTVNAVKSKRRVLGLIKKSESLKKIYSRENPGQFKKNQAANNAKNENTITMRIHKSGLMYQWIKVGYKKWEMLHVYLWKKAGNEIPIGHIVRFKDRNPLNCVLSNLELVSRGKHLHINCEGYFEKEGRHFYKGQKNDRKRKITQEKKIKKREFKKLRRRIAKTKEKKISAIKRKDLFVAPKRHEKVLPTRQMDLTNCIAVKVDRRTTIYVKPGTDIEKIKSKYSRA